jgi:hypothetical protein
VACAAFGWLRPLIAVSAISRLWQVGGRVFVRGVFFIWAHRPVIALSRRVAQRADAEGLSSAATPATQYAASPGAPVYERCPAEGVGLARLFDLDRAAQSLRCPKNGNEQTSMLQRIALTVVLTTTWP